MPLKDQDMSQFQESRRCTGGKAQSFTPDSARRTSHPQVSHNVALVLGGGGAAGNAWEIGVIAGGGVRSPENADLASGYANVVVLSPFGGRSRTLPQGQFERLRRPPEWGMDLEGQVEALSNQGSRVGVITPDADSQAAIGP